MIQLDQKMWYTLTHRTLFSLKKSTPSGDESVKNSCDTEKKKCYVVSLYVECWFFLTRKLQISSAFRTCWKEFTDNKKQNCIKLLSNKAKKYRVKH